MASRGPAADVTRRARHAATSERTRRVDSAPLDTDATIHAALATMRADALVTGLALHQTIVPERAVPPLAGTSEAQPRFRMGKTLGEGGMGVVRVADQVALGRSVAVKSLRGTEPSPLLVRRLLEEAWITGSLEHPNVVPVYDIDQDEVGRPLIVLKRIEGRSWSELMHDPEAVRRSHGAQDHLEWNLRVLAQVCQALRYAHRRGVVHRDLKPENVMLGEFGEVYVLDWGIALAMEDDGTGRFPLACDATAMAGTPCYMAPEMMGGSAPHIGPWTDIYLAGATLYELLTGRPPHEGETLQEILHSVLRSPPALPESVPDELRRIVARAMDRDPDARFENLDQFRLALEGFLTHRGSRALSGSAAEAEEAMFAALARGETDQADAHFAECRFGYRAAIEAWPENEEARAGLRRATVRMVEAELQSGEGDAAARVLASLSAPPPDLARRVREAQEVGAAERARIAAMKADSDEEAGRRTRTFISFILGTMWTAGPLLKKLPIFASHRGTAVASLSITVVTIGLFVWARDSMTRTRFNRGLIALVLVTFVTQTSLVFAAMYAGWSPLQVEQLLPLLWFFAVACGAATLHSAAWPAALAMGLAFIAGVVWPDARHWTMSAANLALLVILMRLNRSGELLRTVADERRRRRESP